MIVTGLKAECLLFRFKMSFIKETSKVNCRPIETLIAESELTLEVQDFNDFIMTKDITTSESVQLMTNSEATW